ncbi:beta-propeller domain-containing protein, partial [bacterium]|nr:beta-propeller domain-containing protein [bacterium]
SDEEKLGLYREVNRLFERTTIHRISISDGEIEYKAQGSIPGSVGNQFSLSEHDGHLRVSSTMEGWMIRGFFSSLESQNSIYVLDMDLKIVGSLEGLAPGERIYATRFLGDKCYLVTFRQIDPFFVLDLSNPTEPKIVGELKIPGYSSYLHPYDENHIIGLGMENNNVKLSLFNVTNVNVPTEIAKYTIQGDYTQSVALNEPKAFLFNKEKQLLVIPVSITQYGIVPQNGTEPPDKDIGIAPHQGGYWQGAFVSKLTLTGFELQGGITHQENSNQQNYYPDYNLNVNRALYIENTLYTISNAKVKLNNLTDLAQIAEIQLN